jgi:hypothetical protein
LCNSRNCVIFRSCSSLANFTNCSSADTDVDESVFRRFCTCVLDLDTASMPLDVLGCSVCLCAIGNFEQVGWISRGSKSNIGFDGTDLSNSSSSRSSGSLALSLESKLLFICCRIYLLFKPVHMHTFACVLICLHMCKFACMTNYGNVCDFAHIETNLHV